MLFACVTAGKTPRQGRRDRVADAVDLAPAQWLTMADAVGDPDGVLAGQRPRECMRAEAGVRHGETMQRTTNL